MDTLGQDLDAQLTAEGVEPGHVFTDKLSGAVNTVRPGLTALLHYAREGDTVVVIAIDRLGRSVAEVTVLSRVLASAEFSCAPYVKAWTRARPQGARWPPSWRRWLSLNSNSVVSVAPPRVSPDEPANYRLQSRPS